MTKKNSNATLDITTRFNKAAYNKETFACKQRIIGEGQNKLEINSDNSTEVVK